MIQERIGGMSTRFVFVLMCQDFVVGRVSIIFFPLFDEFNGIV